MIGNKLDREQDRRTKSSEAKSWCQSNGDMPYYETSAKENISVDEAFIEMAKMAIKRDSSSQIFNLPDSIGGAGGALKLNAKDDQRRTNTRMENKSCKCWVNSNFLAYHVFNQSKIWIYWVFIILINLPKKKTLKQ